MKVVHIVTRLDFGGAQQNTLYTVSHLDPSHFDVVLACGQGGRLDEEAKALSQDSKRPFRLRFFPELVHPIHPMLDVIALLQLVQFFRQESPDVVHTHSSKAGILGRVAAKIAGVPVIVHTYHGFGFHDGQNPVFRSLALLLERFACVISSRVIFVSEANRKTARKLGLTSGHQEELIRSGVHLLDYPAKIEDRGAKKASLKCGMHKPMVVSVGNLKPQKNPEGFVRVAAKALAANPDLRFLFIGDGELRSRVESLVIAFRLHGKVFFPGWRDDVPEILSAADIFVLTSMWEGLPRALVEAMKSGVPSVCYATDGIVDLIRSGDNGYLIEPGAEEKMAGVIVELAGNPDLSARIGQAAARSIGPEFDIDAMVRSQESLYLELAGEAPVS